MPRLAKMSNNVMYAGRLGAGFVKGEEVEVITATNLPDSSPFKYFARRPDDESDDWLPVAETDIAFVD